jgi:hypothetical protein
MELIKWVQLQSGYAKGMSQPKKQGIPQLQSPTIVNISSYNTSCEMV